MPDPRATMAMNEPDRAWRGTAAELAREAARRLDGIGLTEQRLNERQVRYYVAEGVLTRPARAGREAMFGERQLLELQVARLLSRDGWPLAKIAAWIRAADERALRDLIPERRPTAMDGETAPAPRTAPRPAPNRQANDPDRERVPRRADAAADASAPDPVAAHLHERLLTDRRLPPHQAERLLRLQVPGVFELLLPESTLQDLTPEQAERIGGLVRDLLLRLRP